MQTYKSAFELLTDDPKKLEEYNKLNNLMNRTVDIIKLEGWTLEEASEVMGYSVEWLEDIQQGKLSKFYLGFIERLCYKGDK